MDLILKTAGPEDAESVSRLIKKAMQTYRHDSGISGDVLESLHEDISTVRDRIIHNKCICLFNEETPVGTITVSRCNNPLKYSFSAKTEKFLSKYESCMYISRFAVDDDMRNTGLGVQLMDAAFDLPESKESGLILLHTALSNKGMCEFYANRGFVVLDSEKSRGYKRGLFIKTFD